MPVNEFDVCAGGTVAAGSNQTSLTFTNNHNQACNISGLNLPNANPAGPNYTVPARSGSTPGTMTITFTPTAGNYPYTPDCCDKDTQPVIIVQ